MTGNPATGKPTANKPSASNSAADTPLNVKGLSFSYASKAGAVPVLHNVSLTTDRGQWVAIMGPSGSGKSTLLLCAAGLLRADSGTAAVDGLDVVDASEKELTELRRDRLGFVFQDFNLVPALTSAQNVGLPARFGGKRRPRQETIDTLDCVGLAAKSASHPDKLSGGQRQRVAIARALVSDPVVVFADEPTGSLDVKTGDRVLAELQALVDTGSAVLMVTHDPRVAAHADRVLFLRDGRVAGKLSGGNAAQIATRLAGLEEDAA